MTIDAKYALPFVLPVLFLCLFRAVFWIAGAAWSDPTFAALCSIFSGGLFSAILIGAMNDAGVSWPVRLFSARAEGGEG